MVGNCIDFTAAKMVGGKWDHIFREKLIKMSRATLYNFFQADGNHQFPLVNLIQQNSAEKCIRQRNKLTDSRTLVRTSAKLFYKKM